MAALVTVVLWSSAFAGIRVGLEGYSPGHLTLVRFLAASIGFVLYAAVARLRLPPIREWSRFALAGLFGVTIYHTALNWGQTTVPAGIASVIIGTAPVFASILSHWFYGERLTSRRWAGFGLSLLGIGIMGLGGEPGSGFLFGVASVSLAAVCGAAHFVIMKGLVDRYHPVHAMAVATWMGTLPLLVFAPGLAAAVRQAPLESTLAGIYIGLFPAGIAYAAWAIALARLPVSRASAFMYLVPPLAAGWGWLWANEVPTWRGIVGGLVALAGVAVVQLRSGAAPERVQAPGGPPVSGDPSPAGQPAARTQSPG